jgi:hypothetical protein
LEPVYESACGGGRGKKRFGDLCAWHFKPGGGRQYCNGCAEDGAPCADGKAGLEGRLCPYREFAARTQEEIVSLDILERVQGQLRSAGNYVTGLDMAAVLMLLDRRGINNPVVLDLIEIGEAAIVKAINGQRKEHIDE